MAKILNHKRVSILSKVKDTYKNCYPTQIIAWKNVKLKIALYKGPVYFSFLKKNIIFAK